jgi:hypothetical protein
MDAGSAVGNLAVSRDGKWVVSGRRDSVRIYDSQNSNLLIDVPIKSQLSLKSIPRLDL